MDPIANPYSPGAGVPPPELTGREPLLEQSRIALGRIKIGKPEKCLMLTGLRGVGKTVLLNEIRRQAESAGYKTIFLEASEGKPLGPMLAPHLRTLLFDLDRVAGAGHSVKKALRGLSGFLKSLKITYQDVTVGLDIDPEKGLADSGDLEVDLPNLFVAVGEAAHERKVPVALLIDEVQYFSAKELGALIMAIHRVQQHQLPIVLFGAGLPILPGLAGDSKSYAERLFNFPIVGPLTEEESSKALQEPAKVAGAQFTDTALSAIFEKTKGYPYFLQEWGYQSWNESPTPDINLEVICSATTNVISRLDENFFRVRFDRLTPNEKRVLRAMAALGPSAHKTSDIANILSVKVTSLGPVRKNLINKGMIYSPAHGDLAFSVPLFDEFMVRVMPDF